MDIITPEDRAYFMERFKFGGLGPDATLQYAIDNANEYANTYAAGFPDFVKRTVAQLHVRYVIAQDRGTKMEIRAAIDLALDVGKGCVS